MTPNNYCSLKTGCRVGEGYFAREICCIQLQFTVILSPGLWIPEAYQSPCYSLIPVFWPANSAYRIQNLGTLEVDRSEVQQWIQCSHAGQQGSWTNLDETVTRSKGSGRWMVCYICLDSGLITSTASGQKFSSKMTGALVLCFWVHPISNVLLLVAFWT